MNRNEMPNEIVERLLWQAKEKKRRVSQHASNRASEIGHPCLRRLTYLRVLPATARSMYDTELQWIFDMGIGLEAEAKLDLQEAGFELYNEPKSRYWQKYNISGTVDTRIIWNKKVIPVEIKGINHYLWEKIAKDPSIDTLKNDYRVWVQKYPAQILIYMLLHDVDEGFFYFKDKLTNRPKIVWVYLESYMEYAESLIQKAETIEKHIKANTLPERITNLDVCQHCEFLEYCAPDIQLGENLELLQNDPELVEKLNRRESLKSYQKEYRELDDEIKGRFKLLAKPKVSIDDYIITVTERKRDGYVVEPTTYFDVRIRHLEGKKDDATKAKKSTTKRKTKMKAKKRK